MQFVKLRVFKITCNLLLFPCVETNWQYYLAFILTTWKVSKYRPEKTPYLDTFHSVTLIKRPKTGVYLKDITSVSKDNDKRK